jgi:hypothetical protein
MIARHHRHLLCAAVLACSALALNACATTGTGTDAQLGAYTCTHKVALTIAARTALTASYSIKDATAQKIAQDAANTTLALVALCPVDGPPVPG